MRIRKAIIGAACVCLGFTPLAHAADEAHIQRAHEMIDSAAAFLRTAQDENTGGWGVRSEGPQFPAITSLVITSLLMSPDIDPTDDAVQRAVSFVLGFQQPDGGIYDRILPSYNTSISLSMLADINTPEAAAAIAPAQDFLKSIQWSEQTAVSADSPAGSRVGRNHPFYGGVGYGRHGRPDLSNLHLMLQGLHDSGLSSNDEVFQRAMLFLARTQMHQTVNDMPYAEGSKQGGFIYATGPSSDEADIGESKAGTIEETMDDGTHISRLRCYGSMTYAGFKSYVYADLDRNDERVQLAYDWIRAHYTLEENPGLGMQGFYYYIVTFAKALDAWGLPTIQTTTEGGKPLTEQDWANDLIDRLETLQKDDGSFENLHDRWLEGDPVLVTAYALIALQHAAR